MSDPAHGQAADDWVTVGSRVVHRPADVVAGERMGQPRPSVIAAGRSRVVCLDGRNLDLPHGTGVATYGGVLAGCLPMAGLQPEMLSASPLLARPLRWLSAALPGGSHARVVSRVDEVRRWAAPDLFRIAQVHFDLWRCLRPVRCGVTPAIMHWTYPLPLRLTGARNFYTVHDLIPLLHPDLTGIDGKRVRRLLRCIIASADHLVTVSEATRQELILHLGVEPDRITNTGQAVDVSGANTIGAAGLGVGEYWLHVGAVERRKNLRRVIEAWRASGTRYPLVLAGPDGWNAEEQLADAPLGDPGQGAVVIRLAWLPRPCLLALIRDARALFMPSLAEGFGLPVAEALALGTPVLTSDRGALAEVAGAATLLVNPSVTQAIAEAVRALDADAALRAKLSALGLRRARAFDRSRYAERLAALY